jgi:hypothetical protein
VTIPRTRKRLGSLPREQQPRTSVGTLKTGYPRIQALSQDKEHVVHPHAVTQAVALDHTSLQRWAPALLRVPQLRASPPCRGGLRRCHVSQGSRLYLPERRAPALPRVSQLRTSPPCRGGLRRCHVVKASPPRAESSDAATYPTALSGLWTTGIKKGLAAPGTQLGSLVSKARSHVTKVFVRHTDIPLQFGLTVQRRPS